MKLVGNVFWTQWYGIPQYGNNSPLKNQRSNWQIIKIINNNNKIGRGRVWKEAITVSSKWHGENPSLLAIIKQRQQQSSRYNTNGDLHHNYK